MIERICILCLIIIIKSEVCTITHCLGLGHETMVSAVCLSMFLPRMQLSIESQSPITYVSKMGLKNSQMHICQEFCRTGTTQPPIGIMGAVLLPGPDPMNDPPLIGLRTTWTYLSSMAFQTMLYHKQYALHWPWRSRIDTYKWRCHSFHCDIRNRHHQSDVFHAIPIAWFYFLISQSMIIIVIQ